MLKLKKNGFRLYLLGILISFISPLLVFGSDNLLGQAFSLYYAISGGLFLLLYFLSGALAMPLWHRVASKRSKSFAWGSSMLLACLTFVWAFLLEPGDIWPFAIICILSGTAFGADLALPPAMIADHLVREQHARVATRYYALLAFFSKAALAIATGITLTALGWAGYQPGTVDTTGALPVAYALIPCIIKMLAALLLIRSPVLHERAPHDA
jgi:Na+/melibiose symporter-like transporter